MAKDPLQVNIPADPPAPPAVDLKPVHDRLENVEQITGDLRERMARTETSVKEHLQHSASIEEALALAKSAHELASTASKKAEKL
ncbi:MAG TPA: hypothetical protein VFA29_01205, partial [Candidatus Baltobacteraceae bacterium]|nr:hypothetical protein [Candidatus Baltobacteraceae bacterium]